VSAEFQGQNAGLSGVKLGNLGKMGTGLDKRPKADRLGCR
jgi:hypothetical protein